ncbi:vanadium-dependent haloperoxidase [Paracoccus sp. AK26]|uniref:vanadium-dependent haloperoxidase n=1 Tax=Paracoccus sp. AK26 TaxID=2589076 RepID=UPI0014282042|nr:vanadium-dependent haloperoxidase [Paracoccus sp. AK26]QIR86485.1 vanadium-dependent haloperoxidase [Paracoccus sp. AK26]
MLVLPKVNEKPGLNAYPVLYWNHVGLEMNRITHSLGGPQGGPTMSSRALGLLHLAMHDAFFATLGHTETSDPPTWLPNAQRPPVPAGVAATLDSANAALTAAAMTILDALYGRTGPGVSRLARETLEQMRTRMVADYPHHIDTLSPAHRYGIRIANLLHDRLAVAEGEPGADGLRYEPRLGRYYFRDEPQHPVRLEDIDPDDPSKGQRAVRIYHGPYYGTTVRDFAVTDPDGHRVAKWPEGTPEYDAALEEVRRSGGAAHLGSTDRTPDQTVAAIYWAYDGANLIGTPPRLYNQILRTIVWDKLGLQEAGPDDQKTTEQLVRLFALANVAMADAGKYAWKEKYRFELWRPLSGIREHDPSAEQDDEKSGTAKLVAGADPFWLALGAPDTNSNRISFKPPFPAYPSGHATFGAACFQIARLYLASIDKATVSDPNGPDNIAFSFVSEELNGVSRDLHQPHDPNRPIEDQPGLVRTYVKRSFNSLWRAMWENAFSRIWLGVHWRFDAFDFADADDGTGAYKDADAMTYSNVWTTKRAPDAPDSDLPTGGIPLGLGIANDIWDNKMRAPTNTVQGTRLFQAVQSKISKTTLRP